MLIFYSYRSIICLYNNTLYSTQMTSGHWKWSDQELISCSDMSLLNKQKVVVIMNRTTIYLYVSGLILTMIALATFMFLESTALSFGLLGVGIIVGVVGYVIEKQQKASQGLHTDPGSSTISPVLPRFCQKYDCVPDQTALHP